MPSSRRTIPWAADPHTLAKIQILRGYLHAWFPILGRSNPAHLLYVDGFAGPGQYLGDVEGSPVAAIRSANTALANPMFQAPGIRCAFLEPDHRTLDHLGRYLESVDMHSRLGVHLFNTTFEDGFDQLVAAFPQHVAGEQPTMFFLDPFGATGVPFELVAQVLRFGRSEVLITLDHDGVSRNWSAGYERVLTSVFGDASWREKLTPEMSFRERSERIVAHYLDRLRSISGVRYTFKFEMLTSRRSVGSVGYFLVFASRHPLGLRRMKEAMRKLDQTGTYQFSNARVGQSALFEFDRPEDVALDVHRYFVGKGRIARGEIWDYVLNETPLYSHFSTMLKSLEGQGKIDVDPSHPKRRRGTYPEDSVHWIEFLKET